MKGGIDVIKIDQKKLKITYTIFALSWFYGDFIGNWGDDFKYVFWVFSILLGLLPIIYNALGYKKEKIEWNTYIIKQVLGVIAVFAIVSIFGMTVNGHHLFMWKDLFYIFLPAIYCFIIINLDSSENLDYYIDFAFWGFVVNFILIATPQSFTMENFSSISFADSYSPWESGLADMYIICFVYYYARKKKLKALVAGILNLLSFKRIHVIFMLIFIVLSPMMKNKRVPKSVVLIAKIFFIISPLLIYAAISDTFAAWFENQFGLDLNSFTMGRFNQLNLICNLDQNMTGLGMTHYMLILNDFDIHRLHCDIMRILLETTPVGLIVFVNNYLNIAKRNQRCFSLMVFFFVIMLSSTFIENCFYWFMIFMINENFIRIGRSKEEQKIEHAIAKG